MKKPKDYDIMDIEQMDDERIRNETRPGFVTKASRVYLKEDADRYIEYLQKSLNYERYSVRMANAIGEKLRSEILAHKAKRCRTLKFFASAKMTINNEDYRRFQRFETWYNRFSKLARTLFKASKE